jgi:hypothetical protein
VYIPILRGALLGQVNDSDEPGFPGHGDDERAFMGGIETLEALRQAARADAMASPWEGPLFNCSQVPEFAVGPGGC